MPHRTASAESPTLCSISTGARARLNFRWLMCAPVFLLLSACTFGKANVAPTVGLEAIATSAYQTFSADMATKQAKSTPTDTPAPLPSPFPTFAPISPLPTLSLGSLTPLATVDKSCNRADWMGDITIPDKTKLDPGQKFVKTWLIQNSGTCTWNTNYKLSWFDGQDMQGSDAYVPLPVPPGTQVEMSINMRAPTSPGDYYGRWQMQTDQKHPFGDYLSVVIKVIPLSETGG